MSVDLWNLDPIAEVALVGAVLAVGPLAWVWLRRRHEGRPAWVAALTVLTLFLTFDLVVFGAFTRLTDSGLGCPDWPGCYGSASPIGAREHISAAQEIAPTGPVTHSKAWIEMIHRYLASSVGVLITVLLVARWLMRKDAPGGGRTVAWAALTFVWVCLQGLFGALTVTLKLYPAIVTLHLLGGLVLLMLLTVQAQAESRGPVLALGTRLRALAWATLAALMAQIALGGWVSTNYAVLACTDFPACHGQWWPEMNFAEGFTLLRELGRTADGSYLSGQALTAIHMAHRLGAVVAIAALLALGWGVHRATHSMPALRRWAWGLWAAAAWQFASGLSNVVLGWPLAAALAHTAGAAALVMLLTALLVRSRLAVAAAYHPAAQGGPRPAMKPT